MPATASIRARFAPAALSLGMLAACGPPAHDVKVVVLGFDGMDPKFVERHKDALPNLQRLQFSELETVMPPQSPVAWSTVITGLTPGGHGVFDFVHRYPEDVEPFSSMADAIPPEYTLEVGKWVIPLDAGETVQLRRGDPFWDLLSDQGVPATMMRMPTDFPPLPAEGGALSGMGTPDLLGGFGTFQFFTDDPDEFVLGHVGGGEIHRVEVTENHLESTILGPANPFLQEEPDTEVRISADVDPISRTARIEIDDHVLVLSEGDWSEWLQLEFEFVPYLAAAHGMVRLFLKEVHPHFKLYVSPVQVDPQAPDVRISYPDDYAAELAESVGLFYTQGMAEDTKALSAHVLTREEYVEQANIVFDEEIAIYHHVLERYRGGFMFNYFSTTDLAAHMLWGQYEEMLVPIYEKADAVIGHTLDTIDDDTTLIVISDHGFQRFDREVHLNRWLMDEGFLALDDPQNAGAETGFVHVDWEQTEAYALGLNGLYVNVEGREGEGIVPEAEIADVKKRLTERLLKFKDPETGDPVVERVYDPSQDFEGEEMEFAPDLMVGFAPRYRMSSATGLGAVPHVAVNDNPEEWIGDHCMAHDNVPGVLFSNRPITGDAPRLHDIPVTILTAFGVEPPANMVGRNVIEHGG